MPGTAAKRGALASQGDLADDAPVNPGTHESGGARWGGRVQARTAYLNRKLVGQATDKANELRSSDGLAPKRRPTMQVNKEVLQRLRWQTVYTSC